jgi:hypothetical protein
VQIDICIAGTTGIANCYLWANNAAIQICVQCSSGYFVAKDINNATICVADANHVEYCTNYGTASPYNCLACVANIAPVSTGGTPAYSCPLTPGNVISNCKAVNITGSVIKCI